MAYVEELRALIGHRRINLSGCTVVVENERGELLLQQRVFPEGRWCFPGGLMELGEAAEDTAKRELEEETSLRAQELSLIGVFSGPEHLCRAANGDEYYVVDIAFACRAWTGEPRVNDGESVRLAWFRPDALPERLVTSHRKILREYLKKKDAPV